MIDVLYDLYIYMSILIRIYLLVDDIEVTIIL